MKTKAAQATNLHRYECGPFQFTDHSGRDGYDRHVAFDHVVTLEEASQRERFEAVSRSLRDLLTQRWLLTQQTHDAENLTAPAGRGGPAAATGRTRRHATRRASPMTFMRTRAAW